MSDEDNGLYRTFGGRNKAIAVIVAMLVAVAFFIAGAVMLGVGIHKANSKPVCDTGNGNTQRWTTPAGRTKPQPTKITAKPFYLTVLNNKVTGEQLNSDFPGSVKTFSKMVTDRLTGNPSITVLSVSPSKSTSMYTQEEADNSPAVGLIAVVYTSDANLGSDDIKNAITNDDLGVPNIETGGILQTDPNKQLCSAVNPSVVAPVTTVSPQTTIKFTGTTTQFTGTTTQFTGTTTQFTGSTSNITKSGSTKPGTKATQAPASDYIPCKKRIVYAIDNSFSNKHVKAVKNFLIKYEFAGNWNHLERLGVLWYSGKTEQSFAFDYLSDTGKDLDFVRRAIAGKPLGGLTTPSLSTALADLNSKYTTSDQFGEVRYVVFVSAIDQPIVESAKAGVAALKLKGEVSFIGLGVDSGDQYFTQLGAPYKIWDDPTNNPVLPGWEDFLWDVAYACNGSPPPDATITGTEGPFTFPVPSSTPLPVPLPCDGRIVVFLDRSSSLAIGPFNNQRSFVGRKLFSNDIFSKYSRLSIGSYDTQNADIQDFGSLTTANEVRIYVEDITQLNSGDSNLRKGLSAVGDYDFSTTPGPQITVIFFVSQLPDDQVEAAKSAAQVIKDQGINLYLVAHGTVSKDVLTQVTGDDSATYKWKITNTEIPTYADWLKTTVLKCPATSNSFNELVPNDRLDYSTYPCSGRIIVAFDNSNQLSPDNYKKQVGFLDLQVFTSRWTNLDRLALVAYHSFPDSQTYGTFLTVDDVHDFIDDDIQTSSTPSLNRALGIFLTDKLVDASQPSDAIFFVSFIDKQTRDDCKSNADAIAAAGCRITFVAMGNGVDIDLLKDLSAYVITWDIDSKSEPDNWETQFWTAYGCEGPIPTLNPVTAGSTKPAPITKAPPSTPKPIPYVPCSNSEGREVAIFFDNGKNLDAGEYQVVLDFLRYKVFNYWSHFERLVLGYYAKFTSQTDPGFFVKQQDILDYLKDIPKTSLIPNIRRFFTSLPFNPISPVEDFPQFYIIFVTSINQDAANIIRPIIQTLGAAKITFVALKDADQTILKSLVPDVISWSDLTKSEPDNWETKFWAAYGCDNTPPTVPPPQTNAPTHSTQKMSTVKPTKPPTTKPPTPVPYLPCKREITFMIDASNDISADIFKNLKSFINNQVLSGLNYINRIGIGFYKKLSSTEAPGICLDTQCVVDYFDAIDQSTVAPIVRKAFQHLSEDDTGITGFPRTFVVFVGSLSDDDVTNSQGFATTIKSFARLSIIGLQSSVTKANMDKLADFSYNLDVNSPPADIQNILSQAYGCTV